MVELRTERLLLRQWRDTDREPFARLNANPRVMRHFPSTLTREQSDARVERERRLIVERGWGWWAVEVIDRVPFIGFVGLAEPRFNAHFTPAVEVGWRLAYVVSYTTVDNERSRKVMERIGMTHDPADDFDHPLLEPGDPLRRHVLYRRHR